MWALIEEVIGAVAVTEIVELPRFVGRASASDRILIDKDFNCPDVPGEVAGILVGLGQLGWRDPCVMACGFGRAVTEPLL